MDNVLIRMQSFEYKGEYTHQSIFKTELDKSPSLSIHDCVFAIENVNHEGLGRLEIAWDSVISSSNNYFLNLSDTPLPRDYPMPPAGFTVLQGAAARAYWADARGNWIAEHNGLLATNDNDTLTGGTAGDVIYSLQGDDLAFGNSGADQIFGQLGDDTIRGGAGDDTAGGGSGADMLYGGAGADTFLFMAGGADTVAQYMVGIDLLLYQEHIDRRDHQCKPGGQHLCHRRRYRRALRFWGRQNDPPRGPDFDCGIGSGPGVPLALRRRMRPAAVGPSAFPNECPQPRQD